MGSTVAMTNLKIVFDLAGREVLCNNLIAFVMVIKVVRLIKMCLN